MKTEQKKSQKPLCFICNKEIQKRDQLYLSMSGGLWPAYCYCHAGCKKAPQKSGGPELWVFANVRVFKGQRISLDEALNKTTQTNGGTYLFGALLFAIFLIVALKAWIIGGWLGALIVGVMGAVVSGICVWSGLARTRREKEKLEQNAHAYEK